MEMKFIESIIADGLVIDNPEDSVGRGRSISPNLIPLYATELPVPYRENCTIIAFSNDSTYPHIDLRHHSLDDIRQLILDLRCPVCGEHVANHEFTRVCVELSLFQVVRFSEGRNPYVFIEPWGGYFNTESRWRISICSNSLRTSPLSEESEMATLSYIVESMVNNRLAILSNMEDWETERTFINIKGEVVRGGFAW